VGPANTLADNNNELPANRVKSFVAFMYNSLLFSPGTGALETALRPAEDFELVIPFLSLDGARLLRLGSRMRQSLLWEKKIISWSKADSAK
jgi:hypothetical protein